MRSLIGILWALGGGIVGFMVGVGGAIIFASLTNMSNRERGRDYFAMGIGLLFALIGIAVGIVLYGRTAPAGERAVSSGAGVLGLIALVAAIALAVWAYMQLRETPLQYDGAMATLEMEVRINTTDLPADSVSRWLSVDVQTAKTRPEGTSYGDASGKKPRTQLCRSSRGRFIDPAVV